MELMLQGWETEPTRRATWAGSLYAVPAPDRLAAARVLAVHGWWVHADVIVDVRGIDLRGDDVRGDAGGSDGTHADRGVTVAEIASIRAALPAARIEVHVIELGGRLPQDRYAALLADLLATGPTRVVLGADRVAHAADAVRAAGATLWTELVPGDDAVAHPDATAVTEATDVAGATVATGDLEAKGATGALVMLIEPGTRTPADPARLRTVQQLAARLDTGVDGGVTREVAALARAAGAGHVVVGRALLPGYLPAGTGERDHASTPETTTVPSAPPTTPHVSERTPS